MKTMKISVIQIGPYVWLLSSDETQRRIYGQFKDKAEVVLFALEHNYFVLGAQ